uniref:Sushi domain-containing protein n=1 Tax=Steinernema glaseri TaxID=37863 RepID=A0A1I7YM45_9BILA
MSWILNVFLLLCLLQWVDSCAPQFDTETFEKGSKGKSDPPKITKDPPKSTKECLKDSLSLDGVTPNFSKDTSTATLTCKAKTKKVAFFLFNNDASRKFEKPSSTETVLKCVDGKWKSSELDAPITKVACGEDGTQLVPSLPSTGSEDCNSCTMDDLKKTIKGILKEETGDCLSVTLTCPPNEEVHLNGEAQVQKTLSFVCEGAEGWKRQNGAESVPLEPVNCVPVKNTQTKGCKSCTMDDLKQMISGPLKEETGDCLTATLTCKDSEVVTLDGQVQAVNTMSFVCEGSKEWKRQNGAERVPLVPTKCVPKATTETKSCKSCSKDDLKAKVDGILKYAVEQECLTATLTCQNEEKLEINGMPQTEKTAAFACEPEGWKVLIAGASTELTGAKCKAEDSADCKACGIKDLMADVAGVVEQQSDGCAKASLTCPDTEVLFLEKERIPENSLLFVCEAKANGQKKWTTGNRGFFLEVKCQEDRCDQCGELEVIGEKKPVEQTTNAGDNKCKQRIVTCNDGMVAQYDGRPRAPEPKALFQCNENGKWAYNNEQLQDQIVKCVPKPCDGKDIKLLGENGKTPSVDHDQVRNVATITCEDPTIGTYIQLNGHPAEIRASPVTVVCEKSVFKEPEGDPVTQAECVKTPVCATCEDKNFAKEAIINDPKNPCKQFNIRYLCKTDEFIQINENVDVDYAAPLICLGDAKWMHTVNGETHTYQKHMCIMPSEAQCEECKKAFDKVTLGAGQIWQPAETTAAAACKTKSLTCAKGKGKINDKHIVVKDNDDGSIDFHCYGGAIYHKKVMEAVTKALVDQRTINQSERIGCLTSEEQPHKSKNKDGCGKDVIAYLGYDKRHKSAQSRVAVHRNHILGDQFPTME